MAKQTVSDPQGPEVIERIARAFRDDRLRADVEGASFVRFD